MNAHTNAQKSNGRYFLAIQICSDHPADRIPNPAGMHDEVKKDLLTLFLQCSIHQRITILHPDPYLPNKFKQTMQSISN